MVIKFIISICLFLSIAKTYGCKFPISRLSLPLVQCYQCGFGVEIDFTKFPQLFGQDKFSFVLPKPPNVDKWCGLKVSGNHTTDLVECPGGCVLVRTTDDLSRIAGCANTMAVHVDTVTLVYLIRVLLETNLGPLYDKN